MWAGRGQFLNFEVHKELVDTVPSCRSTLQQTDQPTKFQVQSLLAEDKNKRRLINCLYYPATEESCLREALIYCEVNITLSLCLE